ncbi:MAG: GDSL-type esterase/lipase family protein [Candidatus Hodarchaeota archaeon]
MSVFKKKIKQLQYRVLIEGIARHVVWRYFIDKFVMRDRKKPPKSGGIVFVGSSTIWFWKTLKEDMAPLPVIRRGFGGSIIGDSTYFADKIILPYRPRMVVLYAGDNDITHYNKFQLDWDPATRCLEDYKRFTGKIRAVLPATSIFFISIKPSSSRLKYWPHLKKANELIEKHSREDDRLHFIDTTPVMFNAEGNVRDELFKKDRLHLNEKGYALWTSIIKPILSKEFGLG